MCFSVEASALKKNDDRNGSLECDKKRENQKKMSQNIFFTEGHNTFIKYYAENLDDTWLLIEQFMNSLLLILKSKFTFNM